MGLKRPRLQGRLRLFGGGLDIRRSVGVVALLLTLGASAICAPPAPAPNEKPHRGSTPISPSTTASEAAVVFDQSYRSPAKDLQLTLEGDRRAEAAARFMHGVLLEDGSAANQSTDEYRRSIALDPANVDLSVSLAKDYLRRGDTPAAISLLKDTIKAAPNQAAPYLALAYIYYSDQNKPDLALKAANQALELDPEDVLCYVYLRAIYLATDQSPKIGPMLERASRTESKNPDFWLQLGKLYIQTFLADDPTKESEALSKTTAIFQKAAVVGSGNAEVLNKVANFYALTKQYSGAIPLFERVLELDSSQTAVRENLARCYLAVDQPTKAAATLEEIIKLNPADPHAYELLGKIYENAGDFPRAAADYEQALLVNPADIQGYENAALLMLNHKLPERAISVLNEARRRFPDRPGFSYLLAVALERAKQHQQSLGAFEQTEAEAQGSQPSLLSGQFYFEYGATAEQAGLYDRAAQLMKKSLELEDDPKRIANTSNYLGYMWVDHGLNVEQGGDLIKQALSAEPDNGAYLDSLGWYYYRTNQLDKAAVELTKAIEKTDPADPTVYEHLGDVRWKQNDAAKAINAWQKAIDLDPDGAGVSELNKKIALAKTSPPATPSSSKS